MIQAILLFVAATLGRAIGRSYAYMRYNRRHGLPPRWPGLKSFIALLAGLFLITLLTLYACTLVDLQAH
jgi:hypothetical protein